MKIKKVNNVVLGGMLLVSGICLGQTVNEGELIIMPGAIMSTVGELDNTAGGDLVNDGDLYLYSHYNNDGLVGFTPGFTSGMTHLLGSNGGQDISGSVIMEWYNVELNNSVVQPGFNLSNELRVSGEVDFKKGIINGENGLVVFESGADHINASSDSYVQGEVKKNGNQAFRFPVGSDNGKYRYMAMSEPDNSGDSFSGKHIYQNSTTLYSHTSKEDQIELIDGSQYWTKGKTEGNSEVFLTLCWGDDATFPNVFKAPYEDIHIVRWDTVSQKWIDEGGVANVETKEVTMIVAPLKEYGVFTLARVKPVVDKGFSCDGKSVGIYNSVSPNDDGHNDYFNITGLENCSESTVTIYNRWGVKVFETRGYNANGNVFKGVSEGRLTVKGEKLPGGTYFYVIDIKGSTSKTMKKAGYLYLNY